MSFENRSTALIDLLDAMNERQLQYVLVGGYAVSAFNTRFSTDLDVVVAPEDKDAFVAFLEDHGFERTDSHTKDWVYEQFKVAASGRSLTRYRSIATASAM